VETEPKSFYERPPVAHAGHRRLLLISYHFPPDTAAGALRWQKLAKHAAAFDWSIDVISRDPAELSATDPDRLKDLPDGIRIFGVQQPVICTQRLEHWAWQALRGRSRSRRTRAIDRDTGSALPSSFARDELRFDALSARSWMRTFYGWQYYAIHRAWGRRAAALARRILRPDVHRVVVTCGPPHGAHEAGRILARATGLPFVMDLRDPWSLVERWSESVASSWTPRIGYRHERATVRVASLVVMNTEPARAAMQSLHPEQAGRIIAVTNGFDDDEQVPPNSAGKCFRMAYAGTVYLDRNPRTLFLASARVIRALGLEPGDFSIELMGRVESLDGLGIEQIAKEVGIDGFVRLHPAGTRQQASEFLAGASVLVNLPQDSHMAIPSKLFEYMRYNAHLLALAEPHSATAQLLRGTRADVVRPEDIDALAEVLRRRYLEFQEGRLPECIARDARFGRRAQAGRLFEAIEALLEPLPTASSAGVLDPNSPARVE
jgi:hypothetical protein